MFDLAKEGSLEKCRQTWHQAGLKLPGALNSRYLGGMWLECGWSAESAASAEARSGLKLLQKKSGGIYKTLLHVEATNWSFTNMDCTSNTVCWACWRKGWGWKRTQNLLVINGVCVTLPGLTGSQTTGWQSATEHRTSPSEQTHLEQWPGLHSSPALCTEPCHVHESDTMSQN